MLLSHAFVAYLVLLEPILGLRYYRALVTDVAIDAGARARYYRLIIAWEWAWLVVLALIALFARQSPTAFGVTMPTFGPGAGLAGGLFVGALGGILVSMGLFALVPSLRSKVAAMTGAIAALLPHTASERWLYAAVSVTAGVCEELVFRGFLGFYLAALGLSTPFIVLIGAIVFGMAHAYQGRLGVVQTGALGGVLMVLFLLCGSVVPGMVCHALIDLRILAIYRPQRATQPAWVE